MGVQGLLKIIIFLLLILVFGWVFIALLGIYAMFFIIAFLCVASVMAIQYILKSGLPVKINSLMQRASSKLRESPAVCKIAPYAKWVMYACALFFVITIFVNIYLGRGIFILTFWIFVASLIVLYAFRDNKSLFYGASLYVAMSLINILLNFIQLGANLQITFLIPSLLYNLPRIIIFGAIAYFAKRSLSNANGADAGRADEEQGSVNKLIAAVPFILVFSILAFSAFSQATTPQMRFNAAVEKGNIERAVEIYKKTTEKGNETIYVDGLETAIVELAEGYITGETDYDQVMVSLKSMMEIEDLKEAVTAAIAEVNEVKASGEAFEKAKGAEKEGDLIVAVAQYKKVIPRDESNYKVAEEKINKIEPKIKKLAFSEIKKYIGKGDYVGAKKAVDKALITLPGDSELLSIQKDIDPQAKSMLFSKANEMIIVGDFAGAKPVIAEALALFKDDRSFLDMATTVDSALYLEQEEKARTSQLVTVEIAEVIVQQEGLKVLYPDVVGISVKNISDKVVKNYTVAYRGSDKNNFLVELKLKDKDVAELIKTVNVKGVNIKQGEIYQDKSVELSPDMNIVGISACVKSVEFADGTKWTNPYYEFWNRDLSSYASVPQPKSTSKSTYNSNGHADSPSGGSNSGGYSGGSGGSGSSGTDDTESGFEQYLKENDSDSYDYYQELEERWDQLR